jgi:hypothetical protein
MSRLARGVLAASLALALTGCETTQEKSAAIAKRLAHQRATVSVRRIATASKRVKVLSAQLVHSASGTAAVLELRNTSAQAVADVPILVSVTDAAGKQIYTNATVGGTSPTGEISLIEARATVWWVDANVLVGNATAAHVSARVGAGTAAPAQAARIEVTGLTSGSNFIGAFIAGRAINGSAAASDLTVYAVALSAGRVLAAGQSMIPSLAARTSSAFQLSVVGSPKGKSLSASIVPAHLG